MHVHVAGAGFSGLTAAYYLREAGFRVTVYERESRAGGMISTGRLAHTLVETAANAVMNTPRFTELAKALALDLVGIQPAARARFIFRGRPRRWPLSFSETLRFAFGLVKFFLKVRGTETSPGETLAVWGSRVFGRAALEYLLAPALQGIYATRPQDLSAVLILGSVRARRAEKGMVHPRGSVAPREGMGELIQALTRALEAKGVKFERSRAVTAADLANGEKWVVAVPVREASALLGVVHPSAGSRLANIQRVPLASATLVFEKSAIRFPGFGCLFPDTEGFRALGVLSNTHIFPGRTEKHSETWIFSGDREPRAIEGSDAEVVSLARADRARLTGEDSELLESKVTRWPGGIPRYDAFLENFLASGIVGELDRRGIFLHGNYLGRLGLSGILAGSAEIPDRVRRAYGE